MSSPLNTNGNDSNSRRDNEETNGDDISEENEAQVDLLVSIMSKFMQHHICAENSTKHDAPYERTIINKGTRVREIILRINIWNKQTFIEILIIFDCLTVFLCS